MSAYDNAVKDARLCLENGVQFDADSLVLRNRGLSLKEAELAVAQAKATIAAAKPADVQSDVSTNNGSASPENIDHTAPDSTTGSARAEFDNEFADLIPRPAEHDNVMEQDVLDEYAEQSKKEYFQAIRQTEPDTLYYLRRLFEPGDWIDLQFIHQTETWTDEHGGKHARVDDNFMTLEQALKPETRTLEQSKAAQDKGWNVYVGMNAFTPGLRRRRKKDVKDVRSVYIEFDENGDAGLEAIRDDNRVPEPHFILQSSPGKYYAIWFVEGFTVDQQEALNSALQKRYGSDPASVDAARVLRLPGTRNLKPKYNPTPTVQIIEEGSTYRRYSIADFEIDINAKQPKGPTTAIASEKLARIVDVVLTNLDDANVGHGDAEPFDNGYKIDLDECLWGKEHTNGSVSDSSIFIDPSGRLGHKCFHSHCSDRHWKEFREELERRAGHKLSFDTNELLVDGKTIQEKAAENGAEPTTAVTNSTLLIFLKREQELAASTFGFKAVTADHVVLQDLQKYDRVVLFEFSNTDSQKWDATGLQQQIRHSIRIRVHASDVATKESLSRILSLEAITSVHRNKPRMRWVQIPEDEPKPAAQFPERMPESALASTRLQDIYAEIFEPNDIPLDFAMPGLVTAASVCVPPLPEPESKYGLVIGDDPLVTLFTALIGPVGSGKSQTIEWAAKALGIYSKERGPHFYEVMAGSAEQLIDDLHKKKKAFQGSLLITPDEWSHLFAKAAIQNASFPSFLTRSYYRKKQTFLRPRAKEITLDLAMSFIGGIVEDDFDTVFNAATLGGVYDRFLFGRAPDGYAFDYKPYPRQVVPFEFFNWKPVPVQVDGSVWELAKSWNKRDRSLGRIIEVCTRVATIYASMDGRALLTAADMEPLWGLTQYQAGLRSRFQPNAGVVPDAVFANAALAWIERNAHDWRTIRDLKRGTHTYQRKLGPSVAERALMALARTDQIELWLAPRPGIDKPLPIDYTGPTPRVGLVRKVRSAD
jgi:DNA primase RepB-like protein